MVDQAPSTVGLKYLQAISGRIPSQIWTNFLANSEYKTILTNWILDSTSRLLFVNILPNGSLRPSLVLPNYRTAKSVYCLKKSFIPLSDANVENVLITGELSPMHVHQHLQMFLKSICVPLLGNTKNRRTWTLPICHDIDRTIDQLFLALSDCQSSTNGRHIELFAPANMDEILHNLPNILSGETNCSTAIRNAIEGAVIKWSFQLDDLFTHDRSARFNMTTATPFDEIAYWRTRRVLLEQVQRQLFTGPLKEIGDVLLFINSVYSDAYKKILETTRNELEQTRDVVIYLNAVEGQLNAIRSSDFDKLTDLVRPVLHCLALMWSRIWYYKVGDWERLFRMVCNLCMQEAARHLDASSMFQADEEELANRLHLAIDLMERLPQEIRAIKTTLVAVYQVSTTTQSVWSFSTQFVCSRIQLFVERVRCIQQVNRSAIELSHLDRIVGFCGWKGKLMCDTLCEIAQSYRRVYSEWAAIGFDVLDVDRCSHDFQILWQKYVSRTDELERKLAQVLQEAFAHCYTTELSMKLIQVSGSLLNRKLIEAELSRSLQRVVELYAKDVSFVEQEINNKLAFNNEIGGLHQLSAHLMMIYRYRFRLAQPVSELSIMDVKLFESAVGVKTLEHQSRVQRKLDDLENKTLDLCHRELDAKLKENVQKNLLRKIVKETDPEKKEQSNKIIDTELSVNQSDELLDILQFFRTFQRLGFGQKNEHLSEMFLKTFPIWDLQVNLEESSNHYNFIYKQCSALELNILQTHLNRVNMKLVPFHDSFTWIDYDVEVVHDLHKDLTALHNCIAATHSNVALLRQNIIAWSHNPLYQRFPTFNEGGQDSEMCLQLRMELMDAARQETRRTVAENLRYFQHCGQNQDLASVTDAEVQVHIARAKRNSFKSFIGLTHQLRNKANKVRTSVGDLAKKNAQSIKTTEVNIHLDLSNSYEQHLNSLLAHEVYYSAFVSLNYIKQQLTEAASPFIRICVCVDGDDIRLQPSQSQLSESVDTMIANISGLTGDTPLDCNSCDSVLHQTPLLNDIRSDILRQFEKTMETVTKCVASFGEFDHIWKQPRDVIIDTQSPESSWLKDQIKVWEHTIAQVQQQLVDQFTIDKWIAFDQGSFKQTLLNECGKWRHNFQQLLVNRVAQQMQEIDAFIRKCELILSDIVHMKQLDRLLAVMSVIREVNERNRTIEQDLFAPLENDMEFLKVNQVEDDGALFKRTSSVAHSWSKLVHLANSVDHKTEPSQRFHMARVMSKMTLFDEQVDHFRGRFQKVLGSDYGSMAYQTFDRLQTELAAIESSDEEIDKIAELFGLTPPDSSKIHICRKELNATKALWDYVLVAQSCKDHWIVTAWLQLDLEDVEQSCKQLLKEIRGLGRHVQGSDVFTGLEMDLKNMLTALRSLAELRNPAIQERHWDDLMRTTGMFLKFGMDILMTLRRSKKTTLAEMLQLNLHEFEEDVKHIVDRAVKEQSMAKFLKDVNSAWKNIRFTFIEHDRSNVALLHPSDILIETLEDHQVQVNAIINSKYVAIFEHEFQCWAASLSRADEFIVLWTEAQRKWIYLESIFIRSEDLRQQLPEKSIEFDSVDRDFRQILRKISEPIGAIEVTNQTGLTDQVELLLSGLADGEKALNDYLEKKRLVFPRFYFIATVDLLDILSNGNAPLIATRHLPKLFDSVDRLKLETGDHGLFTAHGMISKEHEEFVEFNNSFVCTNNIEVWLNRITTEMQSTLRHMFGKAFAEVSKLDSSLERWILMWSAQTTLCISQILWSIQVNRALSNMQLGYESALRDYHRSLVSQLSCLIGMLLGDLTPGDRQRIMTICTIQVHSRDIVSKMIARRVDTCQAFQWQSQLRHRWDAEKEHCYVNICDAQFRYQYEYLGNTPRLVITPLTDRCYITLTQSLHLVMGGAPSGPAGTGKTETTKDLGKGMGSMVYVFNCSGQMDYRSCAMIYKGLAQTGAWGCFDEFNRIAVDVLSVVAVQVKCILDALKREQSAFLFMGEPIRLVSSVGLFVTMNPGYAGRTELPENLKALFRPCAMVVPDLALICEIMLVAEGFQSARSLARKFISLYTLCRQLLSAQDHYDWGLRAIKSVLVVAGTLRRKDCQKAEEHVLMRALRDFNLPKIVSSDIGIFLGLINDLFPLLEVPTTSYPELEIVIRSAAEGMGKQPDAQMIEKVIQLNELLEVRHSVFLVGNAGTGKTTIWRTLFQTMEMQDRRPMYNDLNPKGVTNDELYGVINPVTREWRDGLFSKLMRDQMNHPVECPKWLVLDGDIDPLWIESLNTVMDDNKVLTLASNERITLNADMRLLFEAGELRYATPATISRAGILFINTTHVTWEPFVTSWIESYCAQDNDRHSFAYLFDKYIPIILNKCKEFKRITPVTDIAMAQMTCLLLECLGVAECNDEQWREKCFVFAVIWGYGATFCKDQIVDWQQEFNRFWLVEFKEHRFPEDDVYGYWVDVDAKVMRLWSKLQHKVDLSDDISQCTLIPTKESVQITWFLEKLLKQPCSVMLIGAAGTGKSMILRDNLNALPDTYKVVHIPFNYYTNSITLQKTLEEPLEKKSGQTYGPSCYRRVIYFADDLNMPEMDQFGTVQPHQIIRQFMDYGHWYDRCRHTLRLIKNCQFVASMNPAAGTFRIDPRLQRHFHTFAVSSPGQASMFHIYNTILSHHLSLAWNRFSVQHMKMVTAVVSLSLLLHHRVGIIFLPTALKFHYIFNLRDLSNIYQGMMFATVDTCPEPEDLVRLFLHEACRVYGDKLATQMDVDNFKKLLREVTKNELEEVNEQRLFQEPLIYCHFGDGLTESKYMPVAKWTTLHTILENAQKAYNEMVGPLSLVLFEDAMCHVCRINRILEGVRGNLMLVGVGGSGKQSLVKLSSFISSITVSQVRLRRGYSLVDFKAHINGLFCQVGLKNIASVLLMSDAQIQDESFLVVVNDLLAAAEIQDLFSSEEVDGIIDSVRNEVKQSGQLDSKVNCWRYFVDKVAIGLKIVLCFSPVGATLRQRARKFPAIANCTAVDWFHEWPKTALQSVSTRFLQELPVLATELVEPISIFMSLVLDSVKRTAQKYWNNEHRYYYITPKSYLASISLYSELLRSKTKDTRETIQRLENGLVKLSQCAELVEDLKKTLCQQEITMAEKHMAADRLIVVVGGETEIVQREKILAADEERRVRRIEEDVQTKAKLCEKDLREAEPALQAAQMALNTLNKINLTELKSFGAPPQAVINVCAAVLVLCSGRHHRLPKDRSWRACKHMMGSVDRFLMQLVRFDKEHIPPKVISALQPYLNDPEFDPMKIISKSVAASGLCAWVINIHKFHAVYLVVGPKQKALKNAQQELDEAQQKLITINEKIQTIEKQWMAIQMEFETAVTDKNRYQREAERTTLTIDLAHRLVNGLSSEAQRWHRSVERLRIQFGNLPGDMLFVSSFVAYVGGFLRPYRVDLVENSWKPALNDIKPEIPRTKNFNLFEHFCDDAQIAKWNNEGLPTDQMSTENAIIFEHTDRWPLLIDPQLQGLKWIKRRFGDALLVTNSNRRNYLDIIEGAIKLGQTVLMEHVGESMDAVLENLLSRSTVNKGRSFKIGDREVDLHGDFRLILQTKLANPHYKPELQAQLTLINFAVTRDGLEDQLLAEVVRAECPELESSKSQLTELQNSFKIRLKRLEIDLLEQLSAAGDNVLTQPTLVVNLEETKQIAKDVERQADESRQSAALLDEAREKYRPVATRASILYFVLNDLCKINRMYQFSLKAFVVIFKRAIAKNRPKTSFQSNSEEPEDAISDRINALTESITYAIFLSTCRGLFERDKLVFIMQMVLQIFHKIISPEEVYYFLKFPSTMNAVTSPVEFLSDRLWAAVRQLSAIKGYMGIDQSILKASVRWKGFVESDTPELEKMPGEWHKMMPFQRLVVLRTLRPDRVVYATWMYVEETMGTNYTERRKLSLADSYAEISDAIPMFFILSPGVDPLIDVEKLGQQLGFCIENANFHNVSLGQGQESVAEAAIRGAKLSGDWVVLQNVHLVSSWLPTLNGIIEETEEIASHSDYRLFISAEPAVSADDHQIPQGILESSLKITNEPPTGMKSNVHSALDTFSQDTLEMCTKETEFKSILFALCFFHSILLERRKFGAPGWNQRYPFSIGDLTISVYVLYNYLETNRFVPWEDLRYLIGEIMYGGHITDDWDRRLCRTYLFKFLQPDLIDGDLEFCHGFKAPSNNDFKGYHKYVRDSLPAESPMIYRMHANSEIDFLTTRTNDLLATIFQLRSSESTRSQHNGRPSKEELLRLMIDEYQDKLPDDFSCNEVGDNQEYPSPYTVVVLQETQRMNVLFAEMRRSLRELWLGLRGELNMTPLMEQMEESLLLHRVPRTWSALAYPSNMELHAWFGDLLTRHREMSAWSQNMALPTCVWLGGLFNPQSFLTAIMQSMARKHRWPLDRMCLNVDVTSKCRDDFGAPPKDGALVCHLFMEGARWDSLSNSIGVALPKELYAEMPVVLVKATTQDKQDMRNVYECPVYRTKSRSSTYIWTFNIKSRCNPSKWILAGVAMLLQK